MGGGPVCTGTAGAPAGGVPLTGTHGWPATDAAVGAGVVGTVLELPAVVLSSSPPTIRAMTAPKANTITITKIAILTQGLVWPGLRCVCF